MELAVNTSSFIPVNARAEIDGYVKGLRPNTGIIYSGVRGTEYYAAVRADYGIFGYVAKFRRRRGELSYDGYFTSDSGALQFVNSPVRVVDLIAESATSDHHAWVKANRRGHQARRAQLVNGQTITFATPVNVKTAARETRQVTEMTVLREGEKVRFYRPDTGMVVVERWRNRAYTLSDTPLAGTIPPAAPVLVVLQDDELQRAYSRLSDALIVDSGSRNEVSLFSSYILTELR